MNQSIQESLEGEQLRLGDAGGRLFKLGLVVGIIGFVLACWSGLQEGDGGARFLHGYLTNFVYFLSLALGGLFFVLIQHLTRAGWSVVVRRLAELVASTMPLLALLVIPIVAAVWAENANLYEWADVELMHHDHLLHKKAPYLNKTFFVIRCVLYFTLWTVLARFYMKRSTLQDETGDAWLTAKMQALSPVGTIFFALTLTFAAFDFLMSLTPRWFSTIFGVYYFAGAFMSFMALLVLLMRGVQKRGCLQKSITVEHYHDAGKLFFAFVFFWGYIAFSQFMLIWYADIPEETEWFLHRQEGAWGAISVLLIFGHFVVPFLGLISRHVKRNPKVLAVWAVFMLMMHWVDLYWIVMPHFDAHHPVFGLVEIGCFAGMGGLFVAAIAHMAGSRSLLPVKDPRLAESLAFENV